MQARTFLLPALFALAVGAGLIALNFMGSGGVPRPGLGADVARLESSAEGGESTAPSVPAPLEEVPEAEVPVAEVPLEEPQTAEPTEPTEPAEAMPTDAAQPPAPEETQPEPLVPEPQAPAVQEPVVEEPAEQPDEETPAEQIVPEPTTEDPADAQPAEAQPVEESPTEENPAPEDQPLGMAIVLSELSGEEQPRFGRTTIENSGNLAITRGRGVPGTVVEVLVNDMPTVTANVDLRGYWAVYEAGILGAGLQTISLRTTLVDGRIGLSDDHVIAVLDPAAETRYAEVAVLRQGNGGMQFLSEQTLVTAATVTSLSYGENGVTLMGSAPAGDEIRFAINGQDIEGAPGVMVGTSRAFSFDLGQVAGQSGILIHLNPVSNEVVSSQTITLPAMPSVGTGEVSEGEDGVSLRAGEEVLLFL